MGGCVGMYFQERKKLTRSNLVNKLMTDLLANKLMILLWNAFGGIYLAYLSRTSYGKHT